MRTRVAACCCCCLLLTAIAPSAVTADKAEIKYLLYCGGCHLPDGTGAPPEVPTLHDVPGRIESMKGGRDYLVRVPGAAQAPMTDADLAVVLNYLLARFSSATLADDFKPYTGKEVATYRHDILADPLKRRAEIIDANR